MQNEQINSGKKKRGKSFWVSLIVIAVLIPLTVGISWYLGYRFDSRDKALLAIMCILVAMVLVCGIMGGAKAVYTPALFISWFDNMYTAAGLAAYFIFLSIPTVLNITEAITWRILRSKI